MNNGTHDSLNLAPRPQAAILDEIRNDHELIARLNITPQEFEALSKCAMLGTLTCKQDMLFILRQIREASSPAIDHTNLLPARPQDVREEDRVPDIRHVGGLIRPWVGPEQGLLEGSVSRRMLGRFGILFWGAVLAVALVAAMIVISRWHGSLIAAVGAPVSASSPTGAWYSRIDRFGVLLAWEALFLIVILAFTYIRQQRESRRFKVKPGGRYF
jgi:hypothetical protein